MNKSQHKSLYSRFKKERTRVKTSKVTSTTPTPNDESKSPRQHTVRRQSASVRDQDSDLSRITADQIHRNQQIQELLRGLSERRPVPGKTASKVSLQERHPSDEEVEGRSPLYHGKPEEGRRGTASTGLLTAATSSSHFTFEEEEEDESIRTVDRRATKNQSPNPNRYARLVNNLSVRLRTMGAEASKIEGDSSVQANEAAVASPKESTGATTASKSPRRSRRTGSSRSRRLSSPESMSSSIRSDLTEDVSGPFLQRSRRIDEDEESPRHSVVSARDEEAENNDLLASASRDVAIASPSPDQLEPSEVHLAQEERGRQRRKSISSRRRNRHDDTSPPTSSRRRSSGAAETNPQTLESASVVSAQNLMEESPEYLLGWQSDKVRKLPEFVDARQEEDDPLPEEAQVEVVWEEGLTEPPVLSPPGSPGALGSSRRRRDRPSLQVSSSMDATPVAAVESSPGNGSTVAEVAYRATRQAVYKPWNDDGNAMLSPTQRSTPPPSDDEAEEVRILSPPAVWKPSNGDENDDTEYDSAHEDEHVALEPQEGGDGTSNTSPSKPDDGTGEQNSESTTNVGHEEGNNLPSSPSHPLLASVAQAEALSMLAGPSLQALAAVGLINEDTAEVLARSSSQLSQEEDDNDAGDIQPEEQHSEKDTSDQPEEVLPPNENGSSHSPPEPEADSPSNDAEIQLEASETGSSHSPSEPEAKSPSNDAEIQPEANETGPGHPASEPEAPSDDNADPPTQPSTLEEDEDLQSKTSKPQDCNGEDKAIAGDNTGQSLVGDEDCNPQTEATETLDESGNSLVDRRCLGSSEHISPETPSDSQTLSEIADQAGNQPSENLFCQKERPCSRLDESVGQIVRVEAILLGQKDCSSSLDEHMIRIDSVADGKTMPPPAPSLSPKSASSTGTTGKADHAESESASESARGEDSGASLSGTGPESVQNNPLLTTTDFGEMIVCADVSTPRASAILDQSAVAPLLDDDDLDSLQSFPDESPKGNVDDYRSAVEDCLVAASADDTMNSSVRSVSDLLQQNNLLLDGAEGIVFCNADVSTPRASEILDESAVAPLLADEELLSRPSSPSADPAPGAVHGSEAVQSSTEKDLIAGGQTRRSAGETPSLTVDGDKPAKHDTPTDNPVVQGAEAGKIGECAEESEAASQPTQSDESLPRDAVDSPASTPPICTTADAGSTDDEGKIDPAGLASEDSVESQASALPISAAADPSSRDERGKIDPVGLASESLTRSESVVDLCTVDGWKRVVDQARQRMSKASPGTDTTEKDLTNSSTAVESVLAATELTAPPESSSESSTEKHAAETAYVESSSEDQPLVELMGGDDKNSCRQSCEYSGDAVEFFQPLSGEAPSHDVAEPSTHEPRPSSVEDCGEGETPVHGLWTSAQSDVVADVQAIDSHSGPLEGQTMTLEEQLHQEKLEGSSPKEPLVVEDGVQSPIGSVTAPLRGALSTDAAKGAVNTTRDAQTALEETREIVLPQVPAEASRPTENVKRTGDAVIASSVFVGDIPRTLSNDSIFIDSPALASQNAAATTDTSVKDVDQPNKDAPPANLPPPVLGVDQVDRTGEPTSKAPASQRPQADRAPDAPDNSEAFREGSSHSQPVLKSMRSSSESTASTGAPFSQCLSKRREDLSTRSSANTSPYSDSEESRFAGAQRQPLSPSCSSVSLAESSITEASHPASCEFHVKPAFSPKASVFRRQNSSPSSLVNYKPRSIKDLLRRDLRSTDEAVVERALQQITIDCFYDENSRSLIARSGGLLSVIGAMEDHSENPRIQIAACQALEKLALDAENEKAVSELGGIDCILGAMMGHFNNLRVQESAWSALQNLTCSNALEEMTFDTTEGGMMVLVDAFQQHASHSGIAQHASATLANLCIPNVERTEKVVAADGVVILAKALQNHWADEDARAEISHSLERLCESISSRSSSLTDS